LPLILARFISNPFLPDFKWVKHPIIQTSFAGVDPLGGVTILAPLKGKCRAVQFSAQSKINGQDLQDEQDKRKKKS